MLVALRADDVDLERDRTLVERFQAGDDDAFGELYRRYHERLERFCRRRVADQHVAEEVAQEAFTRALTALPDLGGDLRFYPWVSVIAARLCVDAHRRQSRYECAPSPDLGSVSGGQEDIVDAVDSSLVMIALARVAPRHQEVLHLREVEGWSYQRIATHYGVKVGTVETLLFRARRALRREFHLVDGAGLAALPMFGRLFHLAARIRDRIPTWLPSAPSSAGLAAVATAAVVALAVAPGPGFAKANAAPPAASAPAQTPASGTARNLSEPVAPRPEILPPVLAGTTGSSDLSIVDRSPSEESTQSLTSKTPAGVTATTAVSTGRLPIGASSIAVAAGPPIAVAGTISKAVGSVTDAATALPLTSSLVVPGLDAAAATLTNLPVPIVSSLSSPRVDLATTSAPVSATTSELAGLVHGH